MMADGDDGKVAATQTLRGFPRPYLTVTVSSGLEESLNTASAEFTRTRKTFCIEYMIFSS